MRRPVLDCLVGASALERGAPLGVGRAGLGGDSAF